VNLGQFQIRPQQIGHRAVLKPMPIEPPLAAGIQQPIGHQDLQHPIPARALAAGRQAGRPKLIQPQLFPQLARQPASAPLPGPVQREFAEPNPHDIRVGHRADAVLGKQRHRARARLAFLENLDGLAPGLFLTVIDLAQVERVALHHPTAGYTPVFHQTVIPMFLAIFLPRREAQKHNGIRLCTSFKGWE
jgi:hypothetical protein